jgi:hypothetical protein
MTDSVKGLGKVLETLRRQLAKPVEAQKSPGTSAAQSVYGASARTTNNLQGRARARVAALDPEDPEFHRKARRAFLQIVLSDEFGDEAANDPDFYRLLDGLEQAIDADESLSRAFEELTRRLRDQG